MIDVLRLDERLIHGQIATAWIKAYPVDTLLVIDDESANDKFLTKTLYMAAPKNIKTFVMTTEQALNVLNDPRCETRHIFVVVRTIDTLTDIVEKAKGIQRINVSNYGRIITSKLERKGYGGNMFLDVEETAKLKKLLEHNIPMDFQMTPQSPKTPLANVLKDA